MNYQFYVQQWQFADSLQIVSLKISETTYIDCFLAIKYFFGDGSLSSLPIVAVFGSREAFLLNKSQYIARPVQKHTKIKAIVNVDKIKLLR